MLTKKIKNFVVSATLLCSVWSVGGSLHKDTPRIQEAKKDVVEVINKDEIDLDIYARNNVPKRLQWVLDGLEIYVAHGQLEDTYNVDVEEGEDILGFYRHDGSMIVLESDDNDYLFTLKHELGHAIDIYVENGVSKFMYSNSKYFLEIMQEEGLNLFVESNSYYLSSPQEYFAQCYAMYLDEEAREELREYAPRTFHYMDYVIWDE